MRTHADMALTWSQLCTHSLWYFHRRDRCGLHSKVLHSSCVRFTPLVVSSVVSWGSELASCALFVCTFRILQFLEGCNLTHTFARSVSQHNIAHKKDKKEKTRRQKRENKEQVCVNLCAPTNKSITYLFSLFFSPIYLFLCFFHWIPDLLWAFNAVKEREVCNAFDVTGHNIFAFSRDQFHSRLRTKGDLVVNWLTSVFRPAAAHVFSSSVFQNSSYFRGAGKSSEGSDTIVLPAKGSFGLPNSSMVIL